MSAEKELNTNKKKATDASETVNSLAEQIEQLSLQNNTKNGDTTIQQQQQHTFWNSQPMPHGSRAEFPEGPIEATKLASEIRQEPYTMPAGFEWTNVNIQDDTQRQELYTLLANNYVEDDDATFRFDYSQEFLLWALTPPGHTAEFLFGVRSVKSKKLVAFISAVPTTIQVYAKHVRVVEINFLCVHKKLRSKRLAPVLIKEMTRRANLNEIFQAVYTAGTVLPVPVASARYWHRSLNPKKLVDVGFSRLGHRMTVARAQKLYKLPLQPLLKLRVMTEQDVIGVHALLTRYLTKFAMKVLFTVEEVRHWLLPRDQVIQSYVIVNENNNEEVTDLISFYYLPSTVLHHNDKLRAAYSYYNVATSVPLAELMNDALILAKAHGNDVFNALDLMDNAEIMEQLKFGRGDGNLQYYIYNWACADMKSNDIGIVLL